MEATTTLPTIDHRRLIAARGARRASQVARQVGISRQYLCDIEKGRRRPSISVILALARHYGCTVEHLAN